MGRRAGRANPARAGRDNRLARRERARRRRRRSGDRVDGTRGRGEPEGRARERGARIRSPAGLDLGPSAQEEIAVAILAELVAWRHTTGVSPAEEVGEAIDPICGMTVAIAGARETLELDGTTYYFCGPGCKRRFEAAHV